MDAKKIDFRALEEQRTQALRKELQTRLRSRQAGKDSTLRREVLSRVVDARYEEADLVLDEFVSLKRMYAVFINRGTPHVQHAKDLINAIRLKRDFPNLSQLPMTKQQEILDHAVSHFEELKMTLKMIEHISREEIVRDLRSTVWVIRCMVYSLAAIVAVAFLLDFNHGLREICWRMFNDYTNKLFELLSRHL